MAAVVRWSKVVLVLAIIAALAIAVTLTLTSRRPDGGPVETLLSSAPELDPPVRAALQSAARLLEKAPESGEEWGHLGMLFQVHGLHEEASHAYRTAAALAPTVARWPHLLGIERELLSLPDEAALSYARAIELDDGDLVAISSWARILQDRGEDDRARQLYLRALDIDRKAVAARVGLGQLASRAGEEETAEKSFKLALEAFPRCGPAHTGLARIYSRRGDPELAAFHRRWSRALAGKLPLPDPLMDEIQELGVSYTARMKRAELAVRRGQLELAAESYQAAASLREQLAEPRYRLGVTLARLDRTEAAIEQLLAATQLQGNSWRVDAHIELSVIHADRKSWERAEKMIDAALEIEIDAAGALVQRGKLRFLRRRNDEALAEFERAMTLHPDEVEAYLEKGALLLLMGRTTETESLSPEARKELRCGKTTEALVTLEKALEIRADLATAYDLAGSARMVLRAECDGSPEERARLLAAAIDSFSKQVTYFPARRRGYLQLVRALNAARARQQAVEHLRRARVRWPDDPRFKGIRTRSRSGAR